MGWILPISKEEYIKLAKDFLEKHSINPEIFMLGVESVIEEYLSNGFSVIPIAIAPEGSGLEKKPLIKWKEYQERRPTKEEIQNWFREFKLFNIAIVTGKVSDLAVLDIDDKEKLKDKLDKVNAPIVETGKGYQIYFKGARKSEVIHKEPDIRIKGEGGYVLAPPSVHPSGRIYSFVVGHDLSKLTDANLDDVLKLVKRLYSIKDDTPEAQAQEDEFDKPLLTYPCFIQAHKPTPEGARNETLFALGMMLFAQGYPPDVIFSYLKWFNRNYCTPPLNEKEIKNICRSIFTHKYIPTCKAIMSRLKPDCRGCPLSRFKKVETEPEEEVMVKDEELEVYLPEGYDLFRDYQPELIRKVKEALESGSAGLNAPTGSGKTLMFYVVSRWLGVPTIVVEPNRALQDQVGEYGVVVLKGKRNYICPVTGKTADLAPCSVKRNYKCSVECEYRVRLEIAKEELENNGIVVLNFKNWWLFRDYVLDRGGLIIFDEAHLVIKELAEPIQVPSNKLSDIQKEAEYLQVEIEKLRDELDMLNPNTKEYEKLAKELKSKERRLRSLKWLLSNQNDLLFYKKGDKWFAKVDDVAVAQWLVKRHRCLLVSATLPEGLDIPIIRSNTYIATRKNAPIVYFPIEKLTSRAYRQKGPVIFKLAANVIKMISNYYNADKVVVHVKDVEVTGREVARYLQPYKVKLHEKGNVDKTIEEFKHDDSRFLVVAQMDTGHDFDFVKLQFVVNLPYADLKDPVWKAIKEKYGSEEAYNRYNREMITKLIQICGRVCRGRKDTGITFILDRKFGEVFERFKSWFPEEFKQRLIFLTKFED